MMTSQGNIARSSSYRKGKSTEKGWPRDHSFLSTKIVDLSGYPKITPNVKQSTANAHYRPRRYGRVYAAVEERYNPALLGVPVAVGADPKEGKGRGVITTANYWRVNTAFTRPCHRAGVATCRSRAPKRRTRDGIHPSNFPLYREVHLALCRFSKALRMLSRRQASTKLISTFRRAKISRAL